MPSSQEFPCPSCHTALTLDAETAGREVTCPHCEAQVFMPELASPKPKPRKPRKRKAAAKVEEETQIPETLPLDPNVEKYHEDNRKNFPLHNSQPLLPAETSPTLEERSSLPPTKEKSAEEEQRRLAAMAASLTYEHAKFEKKGMISFGCPLCNRPLWVDKRASGLKLKCEGCGSDLVSPRPELGLPAQLDDREHDVPAHQLPKAVIPKARQVEDVRLEEGRSGGRTKRQTPVPGQISARTPVKLQPVQARGDDSFSGLSVHLPSERISKARTVGDRRPEVEPPQEMPEESQEEPLITPKESKRDKGAIRLNDKRRNFSPQKLMENDVEVDESWGPVESKPPGSRKMMIVGWLALIPIVLGLTVWGIREVFRKKESIEGVDRNDGVDGTRAFYVARDVLDKYFSSASIEEMSRYVRHPDLTLPRMKNFYKRMPPNEVVEKLEDPLEIQVADIDFLSTMLTLQGKNSQIVSLEIPKVDTEDLRIDWESMVHWSAVPWDDFMAREMTEPQEFRVVMQPDDYPIEPYEDKKRWVCFKLYNPAHAGMDYGFCFGYVEVNSPTAISMILPLRRANEDGHVTFNAVLSLRFTPESRGRKNQVPQVMIEKFTDGWILPDD